MSDFEDSLPPTPKANDTTDFSRTPTPRSASPTFNPAVEELLVKTGFNMSQIISKANKKNGVSGGVHQREDYEDGDDGTGKIKIVHPAPDPESAFIVLESSDGFRFVVRRSAAVFASRVVRSMLDPNSGFAEAHKGLVRLENVTGILLEKVCEYFYYAERYRNELIVPPMDIPPELAFSLLEVADYLEA